MEHNSEPNPARSPPQTSTLFARCLAFISDSSFLPPLGLALLAASSIFSLYRARQDPWAVAFILFANADLLALFACLRAFEKPQPDGPKNKKERLKVVIWLLATTLTAAFATRISEVVPWGMAVVVWIMTVVSALANFYGLFVYKDHDHQPGAAGRRSIKNNNA